MKLGKHHSKQENSYKVLSLQPNESGNNEELTEDWNAKRFHADDKKIHYQIIPVRQHSWCLAENGWAKTRQPLQHEET